MTLAQAIKVWQIILGEKHVQLDALAAAETATFATSQRVAAILYPANRAQVQECCKVAQRYQIPIYPVSAGKNWGFGSQVPPQDHSVIIHLSRLDHITNFNPTLGYVTVGAGVTFRELARFLQPHRLMVSIPGASPEASVLANALQRGHGSGPYADRANHLCALEVVLPTGEYLHTGFERFAGAAAAQVYRYGVGPALDGLFMQSDLGIVTQGTIWLTPIPAYFQLAYFAINQDAALTPLINTLQQIKLQGGLPERSVTFWNDYKLLANMQQYPWHTTEVTPLPDDLRQRLCDLHQIQRWNGWIGLPAASAAHLQADRAYLVSQLEPHTDFLFFMTRDEVFPVKGNPGKLPRKYQRFEESPFFGVPMANTIKSIYWRKRKSPVGSPDLDRDQCGKITCTVALPFTGEQVLTAVQLMEQHIYAHDFEPQVALLGLTERYVDMVVFIVYDRDVAGADEQAMTCYHTLLPQLFECGYLPNRLGLQSQLPEAQADYAAVLARLKHAIDPNGVLVQLHQRYLE